MEPVLPETLTDDDTEFDLDVRVHAVARELGAERGEKPGPITPPSFDCSVTACGNTCVGPNC
jgi:hypothetical protein